MQRLDGPASNRDEATGFIYYHRSFMVRKPAGREPDGFYEFHRLASNNSGHEK